MLCDRCQKNDATVHLTQVVEGQVKKIHLCEGCAVQAGIDIKKTISVTDVLMGLDQLVAETPKPSAEADEICPVCGISRSEYKRRGRLGCEACYEAFVDDLNPLIKAVHHTLQHRGKAPKTHAAGIGELSKGDLQAALDRAIESEDYESAARLRDQLMGRSSSKREQNGY